MVLSLVGKTPQHVLSTHTYMNKHSAPGLGWKIRGKREMNTDITRIPRLYDSAGSSSRWKDSDVLLWSGSDVASKVPAGFKSSCSGSVIKAVQSTCERMEVTDVSLFGVYDETDAVEFFSGLLFWSGSGSNQAEFGPVTVGLGLRTLSSVSGRVGIRLKSGFGFKTLWSWVK